MSPSQSQNRKRSLPDSQEGEINKVAKIQEQDDAFFIETTATEKPEENKEGKCLKMITYFIFFRLKFSLIQIFNKCCSCSVIRNF